ncbi:MAG: DNA translocase FtsK [Clostridia bacterium]|nr:DNA translocase FtsK [Clostridia bacterium]
MAEKKPTPPKSRSRSKSVKSNSIITPIILFAVAIFLEALALIPQKDVAVWNFLHNFIQSFFGLCAVVWPIFLGYAAVQMSRDIDEKKRRKQIVLCAAAVLFISAAIDVFGPEDKLGFFEHIKAAYTTEGFFRSGFLGALFGHPFTEVAGFGARIIFALAIFVVVMIITRTALYKFVDKAGKPAEKLREVAVDKYHEHKRRRAEKAAEVEVDTRFAYDIPLSGEPVREADELKPDDPEEMRKKGRRVVDSYRRHDVLDDMPDPLDNAPVRNETEDENAGVIDEDLLKKLDESVEIIYADKKPKRKSSGIKITGDDEDEDEIEQQPEYKYPPIDLLKRPSNDSTGDIRSELTANAEKLVDTLRSFGVETRIINISRGPSVTRYELQPAAGVKISRITNLADDIALNLAAAGVRIEAPIPNKAAVGIEIPNKIRTSVAARELIESAEFVSAQSKVTGILGKDISGANCFMDIAKMPHVLIAGTTGSGKSVCLNSIIMSMLYKATPDEVRMLMIDPKAVEMMVYNGIPHLLVPVVSDPRMASGALSWAVTEMTHRYKILSDNGVRNLEAYNELAKKSDTLKPLPQIVIFIDELADLMMTAPNEVEDSICRLAQKARAAGMHLVIATQRPSVDVITGLIKANIPSRIALTVSNQVDSRTIIDMAGAERLVGRGDMLYYPVGVAKPIRIQGCWISDAEIEAVASFLKNGQKNDYDENIQQEIERQAAQEKGKKGGASASAESSDGEYDELLSAAVEVVIEAGQASTSLLQRKLKLGYARAARIVDQLEEKGVVGAYGGASKGREILITKAQWMEMQATGADELLADED